MNELPETYVKSALYGKFYFLNDSILMSCPIKADGKPDVESITPVDMSALDDDDEYDNVWNISITLEEIAE
jgi:hypothetical protein